MKSRNWRLDRFINKHTEYSLSDTRVLIAQSRILLDGQPAERINQQVGEFTQVALDGVLLNERTPIYIKLNKPKGVVSATRDAKHRTALDLLDHPRKDELHIVGRLDLNTTGLLLLTNNGAWSRKVSLPETKLRKTYLVTTSKPVTPDYIEAFQKGIYFGYENITTQPAELSILDPFTARLTITEGKYHQVKRMFGAFRNEVLTLHRERVGVIELGTLLEAESCALTDDEIAAIKL